MGGVACKDSGCGCAREGPSRDNQDFEPTKNQPYRNPDDEGPDAGKQADTTVPTIEPPTALTAKPSTPPEASLPVEAASVEAAPESSQTVADTRGRAKSGVTFETSASGKSDQSHNAKESSPEPLKKMDTKDAFSSFAPGLAHEEQRDADEEEEEENRKSRSKSDSEAQDIADKMSTTTKGRKTLSEELEEPMYSNHTNARSSQVAESGDAYIEGEADKASTHPCDTPEAENTDAADAAKKKKCCTVM